MNRIYRKRPLTLFLFFGLTCSAALSAQESYYNVLSVTPDNAIQGTVNLDIEISGDNFDSSIDVVEFQASCEDPNDACLDPGLVWVNNFKVRGPKKIIANVDIPDTVTLPETYVGHDVLIRSSTRGRGGKGTTLFKVQLKGVNPSACNFNFEAIFDDLPEDAITSDGLGFYNAIGGYGFRLDTNGSQKMERQNDTRFIRINFSNAMPDDLECDLSDVNNVAGAAGFCNELQGVDMRIEHQIQDLENIGLCSLEPGASRHLAIRLGFEAEPGALLQNPFKNGKQNGSETPALSLNYGCLAPNLEQGDLDELQNWPLVSRLDEMTWRIEGNRACMHTHLGHKLVDSDGHTIYVNVPFGLTIEIVDAQ